MDIILVLTNLAFVAGFFFYLANKIDSYNSSLQAKMDNNQSTLQAEIKDFHGRLCTIEAKKMESKKPVGRPKK